MHSYDDVRDPAEEGGVIVRVPALPEICTQGDTEAVARAKGAIELVIASQLERRELIPAHENW
jgi:predicted RNase H-like HicB family nuclease